MTRAEKFIFVLLFAPYVVGLGLAIWAGIAGGPGLFVFASIIMGIPPALAAALLGERDASPSQTRILLAALALAAPLLLGAAVKVFGERLPEKTPGCDGNAGVAVDVTF